MDYSKMSQMFKQDTKGNQGQGMDVPDIDGLSMAAPALSKNPSWVSQMLMGNTGGNSFGASSSSGGLSFGAKQNSINNNAFQVGRNALIGTEPNASAF